MMKRLVLMKCRRGFALVSVLWAVALLSLIAASILAITMTLRASTAFSFDHVEAKALADAAINDAILHMLDDRREQRPRVDGVPYDFDFAGRRIGVAIQDESGKVVLNASGEDLLKQVFQAAGLGASEAEGLADKVADWRDIDDDKHVNGAEADDYRAAGATSLPRNAPFQRVDELRLVLGVTDAFYQKVAPMLTVYSHRPFVNGLTAPQIVRDAVQGVPGQPVVLNADPSAESTPIVDGIVSPSVSIVGWSFTIRAEVRSSSGAHYTREMVISLTNNPKQPYWIEDVKEEWKSWK